LTIPTHLAGIACDWAERDFPRQLRRLKWTRTMIKVGRIPCTLSNVSKCQFRSRCTAYYNQRYFKVEKYMDAGAVEVIEDETGEL
jgi:hypothetical protein